MKLDSRIRKLEDCQPPKDTSPTVIFFESVSPSANGPVSNGIVAAQVIGISDSFTKEDGETSEGFERRVLSAADEVQR